MTAPDKAIEIKACISAVIGFGTALFGWVGWLVVLWLAAMVLDYLTGTWDALKAGEWDSTIARQGLWHKLGSIAAVLVAALCDIAVNVILYGVGAGTLLDGVGHSFITPLVLIWYIITEAGSILENAAKLGAAVPEFLVKRLQKMKSKVEEQAEKEQ